MDDHDGDVYGMWIPNTGRVTVTRDIIWLQRMYFSKDTTEEDLDVIVEPEDKEMSLADANTKTEDEESDDSSVSLADSEGSEKSSDSGFIPVTRTRSRRLSRPVGHLDPSTGKTVHWQAGAVLKANAAETNYYESMIELDHRTEIVGHIVASQRYAQRTPNKLLSYDCYILSKYMPNLTWLR